MKKVIIFLLAQLCFFSLVYAGSASVPLSNSKFFTLYDFSTALTPKKPFLGFIEPKYKRLNIEFDSVKKSAKESSKYVVAGKSKVGKTSCHFEGTITFNKIDRVPAAQMHYGVDDEYKKMGIKEQGQLIGAYEFNEQPRSKSCGVFKGTMRLNYYVDSGGQFKYDDIESDVSDGFKNNQYKGVWVAQGSSTPKNANWGEYRIPDSGDLDIGAGQFGPNPKYRNQGWDDIN